MGFPSSIQKNGGGGGGGGKYVVGSLNNLVRRKRVDSKHTESSSSPGNREHQLNKALTAPHLIGIGNKFYFFIIISRLLILYDDYDFKVIFVLSVLYLHQRSIHMNSL